MLHLLSYYSIAINLYSTNYIRRPLFIFWFLILNASILFAQRNVVQPINLSTIPANGTLLNKGWKIHVGDKMEWAKPNHDDTRWRPINPAQNIVDIPELWKNNIVWLRLHFTIDAVITNQLAIRIQQSGASELYLNGSLIYRFGVVSTNLNKVIAYDPLGKPLPFQPDTSQENVLAVRYTLQPNLFYNHTLGRHNTAFLINVNYMETAIDLYQNERTRIKTSNTIRIGAFIILFILHLAYYLYYPIQKAHLYFSLFALFIVLAEIVQMNTPNEVKSIYNHFTIETSCFGLGYLSLLTALYFLLNQRKGGIYWSLIFIVIMSMILHATIHELKSIFLVFIISGLIQLEIVRVALRSVKNKQRGALIITVGAINYFVFWSAFLFCITFNYSAILIGDIYTIGDLLYNIAFISIPIATSVHLALDFAFANKSLKKELREVEVLSKKSLLQEQEKQQILAHQNEILEKRVTQRTAALNHSLQELKQTQVQLIQKEKMASLGQLTAGIAHEIQNPLNFVNNFSEVNSELLVEMQDEITKGNLDEVSSLARDVKENQDKINEHGKRAESIVKGMLLHARSSSGTKDLTDINKQVDEFLRLAFHGFGANDKSFNALMETTYDPSAGNVNAIPQEIGRVLLNLFNNAFYTVNEKKKQQQDGYDPTVFVSTKRTVDKVVITVKDNGNGIPQTLIDKIFQPFFTTKPTGQGTGLGLSLAYDIVKAHGGEIKVSSVEGKSTEFVVLLPA